MMRRAASAWLLVALVATMLASGGQPATASPALHRACGRQIRAHQVRCFATWRAGSTDRLAASTAGTPTDGYGPADIASAYQLDPSRGAGQTIAIVDAYDNPHVEADLAVYRAAWGLPACTTANGCFRKVNQRGGAKPPPHGDAGWGVEIALDVQAVSASCPHCHILLVEADSANFDDMGQVGEHGRRDGRRRRVEHLRRRSSSTASPNLAAPLLHPPGRGDRRVVRRRRASGARRSPPSWDSVIAVGGTTPESKHRHSGASARGGAPAAAARPGSPSRPGRHDTPLPDAHGGRRLRRRRPGDRLRRLRHLRARTPTTGGSSWAARACPRR